MSGYLKVFFLCFAVGSCSFINFDAPRNMDNACSILQQRPSFDRAFQKTKRKWGAPIHVQMAILHQESKFIPNAKTPRKYFLGIIPWGRQSSAYGYAQALDGTWADYKKSSGRRFASRSNIHDATDFMGWYMQESRRRLGIKMSDTKKQYLAYHEGHTGWKKKSFNSKKWLLNVAKKVETNANIYNNQLKQCEEKLNKKGYTTII